MNKTQNNCNLLYINTSKVTEFYCMNDSKRLETILQCSQMNPNSFAKALGKERAQGIYDVLKGKVGISKRLAKEIVNVFPEFSETWLLTGLGDIRAGQEDPNLDEEIAAAARELMEEGKSIGGSVPYEFVQQLFEERKTHDLIILSQQKTIEQLTTIINKKK